MQQQHWSNMSEVDCRRCETNSFLSFAYFVFSVVSFYVVTNNSAINRIRQHVIKNIEPYCE